MAFDFPKIDYVLLNEAYVYYQSIGFKYTDVPWIVGETAYNSTKPPESVDATVATGGYLCASGEQSFMQLLQEDAPLKYNFCITPCFRLGETSAVHFPYFMKLELFSTRGCEDEVLFLMHKAKLFFERHTEVKELKTREGVDLMDSRSGFELGSYGIRHFEGRDYTYGTGLALPRLSMVSQKSHSVPCPDCNCKLDYLSGQGIHHGLCRRGTVV